LFKSTDVDEQTGEVHRLKKRIDELQANNKPTTTVSEDVTLKPPVRTQAFAPHTTQLVSFFSFKYFIHEHFLENL